MNRNHQSKPISLDVERSFVVDPLNASFVFKIEKQPDETIDALATVFPGIESWHGLIKMDVSFEKEKNINQGKENAAIYTVDQAEARNKKYIPKGHVKTGFINPLLLTDALSEIDDDRAQLLAKILQEDYSRAKGKPSATKLEIMSMVYNAFGTSAVMPSYVMTEDSDPDDFRCIWDETRPPWVAILKGLYSYDILAKIEEEENRRQDNERV